MADLGAAFGFYPQLNRRRQGSPADSANLPIDVLRGRLAGLLGAPADIANLLRSPSPTEMFGDISYEAPAQFPYTTEKFLKDLPLAPTSRVGQLAGQAASFVPLNPMPAVRGVQKVRQVVGEELAATMLGQRPNTMMSKVVPQPLFAVAPEQGLLATKTEPIESLLQSTENKILGAATPTEITIPKEVIYETKQEGPFFRVSNRSTEEIGGSTQGIREQGQEFVSPLGEGVGGNVPTRISDEAIKEQLSNPQNFVRQSVNNYSNKEFGKPYELPQIPESSLVKQSGIGRVYELALTDNPQYKQAVFDSYVKQMPDVIKQSNAKNYDDLLEKSYLQLAKETEQQFNNLPVKMSFHRGGEGQYASSNEMLKDVYGNKHLYVYQGGDRHDFLNAVNPQTGLNTNEMFRAVHDFNGHAIHGNQFGAKGEEIAWAGHSDMFSPLAKIAMTSETRGQNSFVNYTPINASLKAEINKLNEEIYYAKKRNDTNLIKRYEDKKNELWGGFQFAPQKALILPADFIRTDFTGGVPDYLTSLIKPKSGTTTESALTHYSKNPNLTETDPTKYGTGIAGAEKERIMYDPTAVKDRTYFYASEPNQVRPEVGLGPYMYRGQASSLYDVSSDPLGLRTLAAEAERTPWTSRVNAGQAGGGFTDVERMIKEYGYEGLLNRDLYAPTAIMFGRTPVTKIRSLLE